jgi:hypothetical protein
MKYFSTLPKIQVNDVRGFSYIMSDLTTRANIRSKILQNPLLYYGYDIKEEDTPEIIAHKYYSDPYRYWIVLLANEVIDAQWAWPMNYDVFAKYVDNKYGNTQSDLHHYEIIKVQRDFGSDTVTTNTFIVDFNTYTTTHETNNTYTLPTGGVNIIVTKRMVPNLVYEQELNEKNRSIKILNVDYVQQLENEFKKLMGK